MTKFRWLNSAASFPCDDLPFMEDDELRLTLAVTLVNDADRGWLPRHRLTLLSLRAWRMYHSRWFAALRYLNVAVYVCLGLVETPGWCLNQFGDLRHDCSDADAYSKFRTYGWPLMAPGATLAIESVCLCVFTAQLAVLCFCLGVRPFLRSPALALQTALVVLAAFDIGITAAPAAGKESHFTRPLRAIFVILAHRKLRDTASAVVFMLPRLIEVPPRSTPLPAPSSTPSSSTP